MSDRVLLVLALASLLAACSRESAILVHVPGGDAKRGRAAVVKYECGVCHSIPDIPGAVGQVGPPLDSFSRHVYVAGKFPNTPDVLLRWIADPPAMARESGMPAIPMPRSDARDIAAYLYSLE